MPQRIDFTEETSDDVVQASFARTPDPRLRHVLQRLVHHLHAFARDVELTQDEWERGIAFLTETGQMCDDDRQEFILLSDVLGLSMLVDAITNRSLSANDEVTASTVLGPFHVVDSPPRGNGDTISLVDGGEPCLVTGRVLGSDGTPLPGALVDVWQADERGFYDVQTPERTPRGNLRGLFTTDDAGRFHFRTIVPAAYPIPHDGPVGRLLQLTERHPYRPAHIHFIAGAPGHHPLTTHIFVAGSDYLDSDAVFGVKDSLIKEFPVVQADPPAEGADLPLPFRHCHVDIRLDVAR